MRHISTQEKIYLLVEIFGIKVELNIYLFVKSENFVILKKRLVWNEGEKRGI